MGSLPHASWQIQLFHELAENSGIESQLLGLALHHYDQLEHIRPQMMSADTPNSSVWSKRFSASVFIAARARQVVAYHLVPSQAYLGDLPKIRRLDELFEHLRTFSRRFQCIGPIWTVGGTLAVITARDGFSHWGDAFRARKGGGWPVALTASSGIHSP